MAFAFLSQAQNREVTGKVTDSTGNPLSGASIKIKGARGGTSAGPDGSFRIMAPANGTLVVSAVGFGSREYSIGGQSEVTVQLFRDT
ncbi:MAG TPA: carboxypeptidase regulatory-like domain-containing protein, partial [Puia sp.]|nr:carboxypeptidase regulatory-like domain-containing protein [Puia sp.]